MHYSEFLFRVLEIIDSEKLCGRFMLQMFEIHTLKIL